jgi:hypothetical protein
MAIEGVPGWIGKSQYTHGYTLTSGGARNGCFKRGCVRPHQSGGSET